MTGTSFSNQFALPADQLDRWKAEQHDIEAQIVALNEKLDGIVKRIAAAHLLFEDVIAAESAEPETVSRRPSITIPFEEHILKAVSGSANGLTYAELRSGLLSGPLREALRSSSKTYERAMSNLARRGEIERGYGRVFTPEAFAAYKEAVGIAAQSTQSQPMRHSPMGDAILRIVFGTPGVPNKQVIAKLRENPEFNVTLTPHESGAYNILARLARRQQIVKRDDGANFVGPNFPYELLGLRAHEDKEPNPSGSDSLFAKGVPAPSTDNRVGLRLIG